MLFLKILIVRQRQKATHTNELSRYRTNGKTWRYLLG
jgi:hypothetical protein